MDRQRLVPLVNGKSAFLENPASKRVIRVVFPACQPVTDDDRSRDEDD